MTETQPLMGLHLRYRLWIAEMNADINVLRIFEDYIVELEAKKNEPAVKEGIESFHKQFSLMRKEIDELRHEMHLVKMNLGAIAKENKTMEKEPVPEETHVALKTRYIAYRKAFDNLKKDFGDFENSWLH